MKKRLLLLVILPVLAIVLWPRRPEPGLRESPASASAAMRANVLHEVGVLEAQVISRVLSPIAGVLAEAANDGKAVERGEKIFRIDNEEILSRIEAEQENLDLKREELETQLSQLAVVKETYGVVSRKEEAERRHAALALEIRLRGLLPEEKRKLEIDIEVAAIDLEDKREQLSRQKDLVTKNFAPASSLDPPQREVEAAVTFLEEKRTQFSLAIAPLPDEERLTLEAALAQATDVVERSRRRHEREIAMQQLRIEGLQLEIAHSTEYLTQLRDESSRATVTAPSNGVLRLTRRFAWAARTWQTIGPGQQVWGLNTLGEIVDPSRLVLRVMIHESDVRTLRPGLPARVQVTAFPDQELRGRVLSVSALGQDRSDLSPIYRQASPSQQALFLAEIDVDTSSISARPGMTASVAIELPASEETSP